MSDNRMAEENPGPDGEHSGGQPPTAAGGAPWAEDDARPGAEQGGGAPAAGGAGSGTADGETRRQLLKAGVGLGAVGVIGYAYLQTQEEVTAATDGSTVDDVPERSEFVFSWTGSELLTDDGFVTATDQELGTLAIDGASSTSELFETITAATALDPREMGEVSAFGGMPTESGTYAGLIFESDTDPQTVRDRLAERGHLLDTVEYREQTMWVTSSDRLSWELLLCHLGGNRYALGSRTELEAIVDLRAGDGRRIGGGAIDGFDEAEEGMLRGGFVVPPETFASLELSFATGLADAIEYGSASLSADGVLTVTLVAPNDSMAQDLDQTLNALGQLDREDISAQVGGDSAVVEVILTILEDIDTEVDGSSVRVTVADGFRVPAVVLGVLLERGVSG
ncbi:hypothetical protein [Halovenus sp. HT40]|uniref:hypothetical protein n=1 Tax=Halovenus sp. HT40 TaxID=3126691 RepID=UPI00300F2D81